MKVKNAKDLPKVAKDLQKDIKPKLKKRKRMSGADISALLAGPTKKEVKQKLPPSLKGADVLDLPGLPPGVTLYERPLPPLPPHLTGNLYNPRVDGTFSVPCETLGPIEQKGIERACSIQPKDSKT